MRHTHQPPYIRMDELGPVYVFRVLPLATYGVTAVVKLRTTQANRSYAE